MTNPEVVVLRAPRLSVRRYGSQPPWLVEILAWWRRGGQVPLVLHRVAPVRLGGDAGPPGRPDLDEIGGVIAKSALARPGGLMNAYVASAIEVALEAEALADGAPARSIRTPVHELVAEVGRALQACADAAGAKLVQDRDSQWSCVAVTDPGRLRKALTHLVLRALSGPIRGGAVRIMVAAEPRATRITVLALRAGPDPNLFDLAPLVRLLQATGAALVVEPARAGCTPLAIVLPGACLVAQTHGDARAEIGFGRRA